MPDAPKPEVVRNVNRHIEAAAQAIYSLYLIVVEDRETTPWEFCCMLANIQALILGSFPDMNAADVEHRIALLAELTQRAYYETGGGTPHGNA